MMKHLTTAAALLFSLSGCVHTPEFRDADGNVIPGSIASMEMLDIGGIRQSVWFRGVSDDNPPLILLHGGPGASESALFRQFNAALEQQFLVVYWEQRGTGRSFHGDIPPASMTVARFLEDLDELVDHVRERFSHDQVVLLGHSWGTALGVMYSAQYPEKVAAYVGVAQIADMPEGDRYSFDFARTEAQRREDTRALEQLAGVGPPPYESVDGRLTTGRWVERYGGVLRGDLTTGKLIWTALRASETSLMDLVRFGRGNRFSLEQLEDEHANLRLSRDYRSFEVPVWFLLGRHDHHVPAVLAERYFNVLEAPCKRLVWFEQSAHNPPFEEPEKFNRILNVDLVSMLDRCTMDESQ